jgi:phosphoribosyl 1,2-cyclic phosphodiesterase
MAACAGVGGMTLTEPSEQGPSPRLQGRIELQFWGVRGTLPVPGYNSLRYGGNTSCVSLGFPNGELFIFDAGSGIRALARRLEAEKELHARIFLSHPHWDHINALPFFSPLYSSGNVIEILGPPQGSLKVRDLVAAQMDGVYFPITVQQLAAQLEFRDLGEGRYHVGGADVATLRLSHPGVCLGYRVRYEGRTVCYVTDNELPYRSSSRYSPEYVLRLTEFVRGADALITDTTYLDEEYPAREGWGHSCVGRVAELAHDAAVRSLYLFHHDPDQTDEDIDRKRDDCQRQLEERGSETVCVAPREGDRFVL